MIEATEAQLEVVAAIVREHVPGAAVWVFGSRARGDARSASDLDILVADTAPIELTTVWRLNDAPEGSSLPFRVDVVDRGRASAEFVEAIASELVPLGV